MTNKETLIKIMGAIEGGGGEIFVVGGPVRDMVLGIKPKDIDFLVRKMTLEKIAEVIRMIGKADEVGKSFGVVKGTVDGEVFDFAIPRIKEIKTGESHTDFTVETDPFASVEDDLKRRDFTCNSMAITLRDFMELNTGEIIDPNGGFIDLHRKILRAVGDPVARFTEDPLRMVRGIQFSARLGLMLEFKTIDAIIKMKHLLKSVSGERILEEFKKAWTKGNTQAFSLALAGTGIGQLLFGDSFKPMAITRPPGLNDEDTVMAMMVASFLDGGNVMAMKPEANHVKFLEVARKIAFSNDDPHTFIGNMKPHLHILLAAAASKVTTIAFVGMASKVREMIDTPLISKELDISGEELIEVLKIKGPKDGHRIGQAQRAMLSAIWAKTLENKNEALRKFIV